MKYLLDYNEYDSISLALKENESERILTYYEAFGWEIYEKREDIRYFDIIHIKLKRRHVIPNKDRLQLLQVKMEAAVNGFAIARKNKHTASVITGLTLGVFALAFLVLGIFLIIKGWLLPMAVAFITLGALAPLLLIPMIRNTVKKENDRFAAKFKAMTAEISRIISLAKKLYGGENDEG